MMLPGQGTSKKARQRRNRRNRTKIGRNTQQLTTLPTPKRRQNSQRTNRRTIRNMAPKWVDSLKNPNIEGIKIPDPFTLEATGTVNIDGYVSLTINAQGCAGILFDPENMLYAYETTASADGAIVYSSAQTMSGKSTITTIFEEIRVVSGMIEYMYTGSTNNDSGLAIGTMFTIMPSAPTNIGGIYNDANSEHYPLRNGGRILWYPTSTPAATSFSIPGSTIGSTSILCLHVTGGSPNAIVSSRIVANLEGLAASDNTNTAGVGPSPDEPLHWRAAWEWINNAANKIVPMFGGWNQLLNSGAQLAWNAYSNREQFDMSRNFERLRLQ